jgi:hypothetical protein
MSTPALWTAVASVANCWNSSQRVAGLREELWKDLDSAQAIRPLRHLALREPQEIRTMPFHVYKAFPHLGFDLTERDQRFMTNSAALENALFMLTWFVRSRLPGFPSMPAPQLTPNAYHTMNNFFPPWTREALSSGLQIQDLSPRIDGYLGIDCGRPTSELVKAFTQLPSWQNFATVHSTLTPSVRTELLAARRTIKTRLDTTDGPGGIEFNDPRVALSRAREITQGVIAELSPPARDYALAFEAVTDEIDRVLSGVLSQLVAFGLPETLSGVTGLELTPTTPPTVTFRLPGGQAAQSGQIYWTDDTLIVDALYIENFRFGGDNVHGNRLAFDATVLPGTRAAWG